VRNQSSKRHSKKRILQLECGAGVPIPVTYRQKLQPCPVVMGFLSMRICVTGIRPVWPRKGKGADIRAFPGTWPDNTAYWFWLAY
jgi:hypothetical protein